MSIRVLRLGGSNHDFSAAIVEDGQVTVAIEDERLQRIKRGDADWHSQPTRNAATYCLDARGLELDDIDLIVANDDLERAHRICEWGAKVNGSA